MPDRTHRITATHTLMADDAVDTTPVERNGTIKLSKQVCVMRSDVLSPDATALLALAEDVVALDVSMYQVHEHRHTRTIVSTERSAICIPVSRSLPDLVSPDAFVYCVNVSDEQGFAAFGKVIRGIEIAKAIQELSDDSQYLIEKVVINEIILQ